MTETSLRARSDSTCELCAATDALASYEIPPNSNGSAEQSVLLCDTCRKQLNQSEPLDSNHWRCLNESAWSQIPAVQVVAWRTLKQLQHQGEGWAQDLLDMLYLEPEVQAWAEASSAESAEDSELKHLDSNGALLQSGDTVTLIKDLNVKGTSFTAKRGTAVRNISLDANNADHIEGRVNGQQIVILTKFVKRSG